MDSSTLEDLATLEKCYFSIRRRFILMKLLFSGGVASILLWFMIIGLIVVAMLISLDQNHGLLLGLFAIGTALAYFYSAQKCYKQFFINEQSFQIIHRSPSMLGLRYLQFKAKVQSQWHGEYTKLPQLSEIARDLKANEYSVVAFFRNHPLPLLLLAAVGIMLSGLVEQSFFWASGWGGLLLPLCIAAILIIWLAGRMTGPLIFTKAFRYREFVLFLKILAADMEIEKSKLTSESVTGNSHD